MKHLLTLLLCLLPYASALADMPNPQDALAKINQCIPNKDPSHCRELITASSVELYNRFVSYDLMQCLPIPVAYISQTQKNGQTVIRGSIMVNDTQRFVRLIFAQEEGRWKLDVPESLHLAMGEKWEQQLNLTEQLYNVLKQQMGQSLNCSMIQNLAGSGKPKNKEH